MSLILPDQLYALNRQKIERDRAFLIKEEMLNPRPGFGVLLNALGAWMIVKGERLRKRHSVTRKAGTPAFLKDATIFRA